MVDLEREKEVHNTPPPPCKDAFPPPSQPYLNTITPLLHLVTVKLTHENYLLWKAQMILYLRGQHLYGYIDGSTRPPSQFLDGSSNTNLAYDHWVQQGQLILSALISSLSKPLIAQVIGRTSSQVIGKLWRICLLLLPRLILVSFAFNYLP